MIDHPRDWIDILQALLTPTIALIAVGIGLAQWWTSRNKLRLDLFDRRWAVYVATRELLTEMITQGKTSPDAEQRFLHGIRGAAWLFDDEVNGYLTRNLWGKVTLLRNANSMIEGGAQSQDWAERRKEIMLWVAGQDDAVDQLFGRFLKLDEPMIQWLQPKKAQVLAKRAPPKG